VKLLVYKNFEIIQFSYSIQYVDTNSEKDPLKVYEIKVFRKTLGPIKDEIRGPLTILYIKKLHDLHKSLLPVLQVRVTLIDDPLS
jgi:hypothetical protein